MLSLNDWLVHSLTDKLETVFTNGEYKIVLSQSDNSCVFIVTDKIFSRHRYLADAFDAYLTLVTQPTESFYYGYKFLIRHCGFTDILSQSGLSGDWSWLASADTVELAKQHIDDILESFQKDL